jgi:hypothetical protein
MGTRLLAALALPLGQPVVVPEPSSLILLGAGALGRLSDVHRRRRAV